jgi:hypothetical protein
MAAEDWVSEGETTAPVNGGSWWDTVKNVGQTADDAVRAIANAATFGMADRFAGYMGGQGTDTEVKRSEVARERSPYASIAGDVAGSMAVPLFGAEALAARAGTALAPTLGRAAPTVGRAIGYSVTGAGTGAAQGAGNTYTGNISDYARNALIGGALGGTLGAAGGTLFGRGPARSAAETPTTAQLYTEKTGNYADLARSGARYEPSSLAQRANDVEAVLYGGGNSPNRFHPSRSPQTWGAIEEMRGAPAPGQLGVGTNAIIDPANIDFIRKGLTGDAIAGASPTDKASARIVRNALDDFIVNPPAGAVLPGTERAAAEAAALAERARGNYGGYKRSQAMDNLITAGRNTAGSNYSGLNLENELRKQVRSYVAPGKRGVSDAQKAYFNKPEIAALTQFERGTVPANTLRWAGNYLGGGGGLGALAATGIAGGGIAGKYFKDEPDIGMALGVAAPATGLGLRLLANRRANASINELRNMIAQRTPLYQERAVTAGMQPGPGMPRTAKAMRDALALELIKQPQRTIDTSDWQ